MDECKPLDDGPYRLYIANFDITGRGLHSFTSQLNLSAFYGTGDARKGSVAHNKGVLWGI